ncbi:MAG TPA: hypothetical protein VLT13_02730 [Bacteroidota bacterium]|nr:hypothetical protein [Bacteroidota bacterium]
MVISRSRGSAVLISLLLVCTSGCLEHQVKTTINADGSSERTIIVNTESKDVPQTAFPLPVGTGWDTSWTKTGDTRYALSFSKKFDELEQLSREYTRPADSTKIPLGLSVQRTFAWFTTSYDYRETYGRFTDYTLVDPRTVLTEEEINLLTYGDSTRALKNKKGEWIARNLFEALYRRFEQGAKRLNGTMLTPSSLAAHKEELFRTLVGYTGPGLELQDPEDILRNLSSYRGTRAEMFGESGVTEQGLNAFAEIAARVFKTEETWKLKDSVRAGWQDVLTLVGGKGTTGESFTNEVTLPGELLESNAPEVKGSTVSWKFSVDQLMMREYEMRARSRVVNVWAIALTGLVALALLGFLMLRFVRSARGAAKS